MTLERRQVDFNWMLSGCDEIQRTIKQNLARGCFGPVYWNNPESNLTRPCSNTQVQNNPVSIE